MNRTLIVALFVALGSGIAIGMQSTLGNLSGRIIGAIRTGLLMNISGGLIGLVLITSIFLMRGQSTWQQMTPRVIGLNVVAGFLGILIVAGVAFSVSELGVTASLSILILGQMLIGMLVDTLGYAEIETVPIDGRRVLGLLVMAGAVFLLLPRN